MSKFKISRRYFIMSSAAAVAGCATGTGSRMSKTRTVSPNEKLNVAAIGAGGKGRSDIHGCKSENVVALCDVDWARASETFSEFPNAKRYRDFREMLDKEDIDAVTVSTPDHMHAAAALCAMQQGKHVYVQKPLTWCVSEARALRMAAREYGVVTQMGNQGHASNGVRRLCEMIWNGDIGQVREVHIWTNRPVWPQGIDAPTGTPPVPDTMDWDLWLGVAEERPYHRAYAPFRWRGWIDFGAGALGDMACHIADPANWALRLSEVGPLSVEAIRNEGMTSESFPERSIIKYEFPRRGDMDPVTVYWYDGGLLPERPSDIPADQKLGDGDNGSLFIGTDGYATVGTYGGNPRLLPDERMRDYEFPTPTIARVPDEDPYQEWINAIKGGPMTGSNFDYAGPFSEWVVMGNLCLHFGHKIEWDAKRIASPNTPDAEAHIWRDYKGDYDMSYVKKMMT